MPVSKQLLILFVTVCSVSHFASTTITHWLLGLKLWHMINNALWLGSHALKQVVTPAATLTPHSSHYAPHCPVSITHLWALCNRLDFSDSFNVAVFTTTCVAFWSQSHLGELTFDGPFDPLQLAACLKLLLASLPAIVIMANFGSHTPN